MIGNWISLSNWLSWFEVTLEEKLTGLYDSLWGFIVVVVVAPAGFPTLKRTLDRGTLSSAGGPMIEWQPSVHDTLCLSHGCIWVSRRSLMCPLRLLLDQGVLRASLLFMRLSKTHIATMGIISFQGNARLWQTFNHSKDEYSTDVLQHPSAKVRF